MKNLLALCRDFGGITLLMSSCVILSILAVYREIAYPTMPVIYKDPCLASPAEVVAQSKKTLLFLRSTQAEYRALNVVPLTAETVNDSNWYELVYRNAAINFNRRSWNTTNPPPYYYCDDGLIPYIPEDITKDIPEHEHP